MLHFLKNIFSRNNQTAEPILKIGEGAENPVVTIMVGRKKITMTTSQARSLWGKLGQNLERLTPDPDKYQR